MSFVSSQKNPPNARSKSLGAGVAHCRICGYTPRPPKAGQPDFSFEKIVEHMESKHPAYVYGTLRELGVMLTQKRGDDSACRFHGTVQE